MQKLKYSYKDICNSLAEAGLDRGDSAYFSTSLGMIGLCDGVNDGQSLNQVFFDAIQEVIGKSGTIFIPSYSYSFTNSTVKSPKTFDPFTTESKTGPFSNFFIKHKSVFRSKDPMMSIAGLGPNSKKVLDNIPATSFGEDCVYSRLLDLKKTKCVTIGLGPNWIPFLHHTDWIAKVPFRYDKIFYGCISAKNETQYTYWNYSVRAPIKESRADAHELGRLALKSNLWCSSYLGRSKIHCADYKNLFDFTLEKTKQNKWISAAGPPTAVIYRHKRPKIVINHAKLDSQLKNYSELSRGEMDSSIFYLLSSIKYYFAIKLFSFKTGTNLYDWIVPEAINSKTGKYSASCLYAGHLLLRGKSNKSLLLCIYLDSTTDQELLGLQIAIELLKKIQEPNAECQVNIHLALLPGAIGFAGILTKLNTSNLIGIIHLVKKNISKESENNAESSHLNSYLHQLIQAKNLKHLSVKKKCLSKISGTNPVAKRRLNDLNIENVYIEVDGPKRIATTTKNKSINKISLNLFSLITSVKT